jgi:integrase
LDKLQKVLYWFGPDHGANTMKRTNRLTQAQVDKAMPKRVRTPAEQMPGNTAALAGQFVLHYVHTVMADGNGLYLNLSVGKSGINKSWLWRFNTGEKVQGKSGRIGVAGKIRPRQRLMGLGSADVASGGLSLAEARAKVVALRHAKLIGEVPDPLAIKHAERTETAIAKAKAMSFGDCMAAFIADHGANWKSAKHSRQWRKSLEDHAADLIPLPVSAIDDVLVINVLRRMFSSGKIVTGQRVRQRIESVLNHARVHKQRPDNERNPAQWTDHLAHVFGQQNAKVKHFRRIPWEEVPAFWTRLQGMEGLTAEAVRFALLTTVRTGTLLKATWNEIQGDLWVIPAEDMKRERDHQIPLPSDAVALLARLPRNEDRIFPINEHAMLAAVKTIRDTTVHGISRSSSADYLAKQGFPPYEIDLLLAHAVGNKTSRGYRRDDGVSTPVRAAMLQRWADFMVGRAGAGNVVQLRA